MARSIDTIVAQMLGNQSVQIAALTAQIEDLTEKLAAAEKLAAPLAEGAASTDDIK